MVLLVLGVGLHRMRKRWKSTTTNNVNVKVVADIFTPMTVYIPTRAREVPEE